MTADRPFQLLLVVERFCATPSLAGCDRHLGWNPRLVGTQVRGDVANRFFVILNLV